MLMLIETILFSAVNGFVCFWTYDESWVWGATSLITTFVVLDFAHLILLRRASSALFVERCIVSYVLNADFTTTAVLAVGTNWAIAQIF